MVNLVQWIFFLMQRGDGVGDEIHRDDINAIAGAEGEHGEAGEKDEGADHVELIGFGAAAIAQDYARTENCALHVWQQLADHVLAELFGAGIGIVIRAVPVYRVVFLDDFVRALAGYGYRADVAEAAQAVLVTGALGELDDFESAAQIYVEAAFFGFAV